MTFNRFMAILLAASHYLYYASAFPSSTGHQEIGNQSDERQFGSSYDDLVSMLNMNYDRMCDVYATGELPATPTVVVECEGTDGYAALVARAVAGTRFLRSSKYAGTVIS